MGLSAANTPVDKDENNWSFESEKYTGQMVNFLSTTI